MVKTESIEEIYRRLVKARAKSDPDLAYLQEEIECEDWLMENDPAYDDY